MRDSPYRTVIDAPTRAFIAQTSAACPADATGLDIAWQRRVHDAMCAVFRRLRHGRDDPPPDPTAAVLQDDDFADLPPTAIFAAECDPLCDDARLYRDRIRAAGGVAQATVEAGLVRCDLRARHTVPRARASFTRITAALAAMAHGDTR